MGESCISVETQEPIACGTLLGPLPLTSGSPDTLAILTWRCIDQLPTSRQIIKVIPRDHSRSNAKIPAWLSHIQPARNPEEQNMEVVAKGGQLHYRALREISVGEELRAWFGQDLADLLRLPLIPPTVVEGEKYFECILCHEQFEHPFPVVAHLMYRCRKRDGSTPMDPVKSHPKTGGRVKNFDIATLTDMNESKRNVNRISPVERPPSPDVTAKEIPPPLQRNDLGSTKNPEKRKSDIDDYTGLASKRARNTAAIEKRTLQDAKRHSSSSTNQTSAFKLANEPHTNNDRSLFDRLNSEDNPNSEDGGNSSAFKKVDKSRVSRIASFHALNSMSGLFTGAMPRRELLMPPNVSTFSPFSFPLPSVTSSPPGGTTLPPSMVSTVPHPILTSTTDMCSAFVPTKLSVSTAELNHHQSMQLGEEFKLLHQMPRGGDTRFDARTLMAGGMNGTRLPSIPGLPYSKPMTPTIDGFGAKAFATPMLSFLPPSLAALSFPTQNWCAKCNASFRMTSDLVYHMRSHHKRETDFQKAKREEKLRCHICHETFRERHHLTRHMTSH